MKRITRRYPAASQSSFLRTFAPLSLALFVALGGVATSYYVTRKDFSQPLSSTQIVDDSKAPLPSDLRGVISPTKIQEIANNMGGSDVKEMALENRNGILVYKAELGDGKTLGFDATTGSAISLGLSIHENSRKIEKKTDTITPAQPSSHISLDDSAKLAQAAFPQDRIEEIKIKPLGGISAIEVLFENDAIIEINAETGEVMRVATPRGAVAEVPESSAKSTETNSKKEDGPGNTGVSSSVDKEQRENDSPATTKPDDTSSSSGRSELKEKSDTSSVEIEGILTLDSGNYVITEEDKTYRVETHEDIRDLVGEKIRIKGFMIDDETVEATRIGPSRSPSDNRQN